MLSDPVPVPSAATRGTPQLNDPPAGATTTLEGALTVTIAQHKFTLAGTLAKSAVIVEYHADFADSVTLGTLTGIATEIGNVFGFPELGGEITNAVGQVSGLPVVGTVFRDLANASVRITDLVINTSTGTYGVGVALDFSASPPKLLNAIELDSIGFKVTRSKPPTPATTP